MMEMMVTAGAISRAKLQSNRHHQQTSIQFFTGRMTFLSPNQQCQSTEGDINKLVRPRWPYDMRPSVRAEKYMCVIVIR